MKTRISEQRDLQVKEEQEKRRGGQPERGRAGDRGKEKRNMKYRKEEKKGEER